MLELTTNEEPQSTPSDVRQCKRWHVYTDFFFQSGECNLYVLSASFKFYRVPAVVSEAPNVPHGFDALGLSVEGQVDCLGREAD